MDTPRTDEEISTDYYCSGMVDGDFARTLERELAAANERETMRLAGISTAASGHWKRGDSIIHPDYVTTALHDVADLYAKYAEVRAINAELVAALDFMLAHAPYWIANNKNGEKEIDRVVIQTARAALSKAKEAV